MYDFFTDKYIQFFEEKAQSVSWKKCFILIAASKRPKTKLTTFEVNKCFPLLYFGNYQIFRGVGTGGNFSF